MKGFVFILIMFISTASFGAKSDSVKWIWWKGINISFTWFEVGEYKSFSNEFARDFPHGLNHYFGNARGQLAINFGGIGLYYNDKFGVEFIPLTDQGIRSESYDFFSYLQIKYANYFVESDRYLSSSYSLSGFGYRLGYKFHLGKFCLAPKFQMGFNNYDVYDSNNTFKAIGSNQIVEFSIEKESLQKTTIDYHFLLDVSTIIDVGMQIELGVKAEYIMTPTNYNYTLTETFYNQPPTSNTVNIKQNNSAWMVGIVGRWVLKKGNKANKELFKLNPQ